MFIGLESVDIPRRFRETFTIAFFDRSPLHEPLEVTFAYKSDLAII